MRKRLTLLFLIPALVGACSKATPTAPTPTNPTVATPPATPAPPAVPQPSTNTPVYSTLNAAGTVTGSADVVWSERIGPNDRQVYDDFVIAGGATIRTIAWQGRRFAAEKPQRFYVAIIADNGVRNPIEAWAWSGERPVAIWSATYEMAQVTETIELTRACESAPQTQCAYSDYAVGMATPFTAAPGMRYWVMIQAESSMQQNPRFSWRKGTRDNNFSTGNLAGTTFPWDMAFALRP